MCYVDINEPNPEKDYENLTVAEQIKTGLEQAIDLAKQENSTLSKGDIAIYAGTIELGVFIEHNTRCLVCGPEKAGLCPILDLYTGNTYSVKTNNLTKVAPQEHDYIRIQACHIRLVGNILASVSSMLTQRAINHDSVKWMPEELEPKLAAAPRMMKAAYGTPEWHEARKPLAEAIVHHESRTQHHIGSFGGDVKKMSMLDLIELLCDHIAASKESVTDYPREFVEFARRHGFSEDLTAVCLNTIFLLQEKEATS